jgi:DNA-binding IclR family transcriptional regulator
MLNVEMPPSILSKAFDLLHAFNGRERVMTLSELSRASGLPKSTVHRLLARLIDLGAIEPHGAGYKIGLEMFQLGSVTPASALRDMAMPYLGTVHRWTGHAVSLCVLRSFDIVILEKITRGGDGFDQLRVGSRIPANCTAAGKALLAYEQLEELADLLPNPLPAMRPHSVTSVKELIAQLRIIRQGAPARSHDEAWPGIACLSSPIVVKGVAVGAISLCYPSSADLDPKVGTMLNETTARFSAEIRASLSKQRASWIPATLTNPHPVPMRHASLAARSAARAVVIAASRYSGEWDGSLLTRAPRAKLSCRATEGSHGRKLDR